MIEKVKPDGAPVSAPTAGSIDTSEFRALIEAWAATEIYPDLGHEPYAVLIAHIDTWASRSAGDAVPEAWQWRHRLKGDKGWGAWAPITKGRYDRRADYPNSQFRELFGAAPAPGNTEKPEL